MTVRPRGALVTLRPTALRGALPAPRHAGCGPVPWRAVLG